MKVNILVDTFFTLKLHIILGIKIYLLSNNCYLQHYDTNLAIIISICLLAYSLILLIACLVKGIVFIDYAFGDRNLLNCYLILLSILLDNICITEFLPY